MPGFTVQEIVALLTQYGYAIIFPISLLEGPVVAIISGFLVSLEQLNGWIVYLVLVAGDLGGDIIHYALGRWGRDRFMKRFGKYVGITPERVHRLDDYFYKHDWKILLIGKTQPIGSVILFAGGFTKMPFGKFVWYNFIGTLPKVALFQLAGFYFGKSIFEQEKYLNYGWIFAIALLVLYYLVKYYVKSRNKQLTK
jgi:membrane protein DedA with SNARE-associated domain